MRVLLPVLMTGLLAAQQGPLLLPPSTPPSAVPRPAQQTPAPTPTPSNTSADGAYKFATSIDNVVAPTLVYSRDGGYVTGIRPEQFHLFDNDREQNIHVDEIYQPISMVVLVQANSRCEGLLPQVTRIGSMIGPQVVGVDGEIALVAYDARIRVLQEFTKDASKITDAVKKIKPGSESSRMVDAVEEATRMLRSRPKGQRRVILLIGETRDMGSEARVRETLMGLQLHSIAFYSVDMSRFINTLLAPPKVSRPDPLPPAARGPLPGGVPSTPTTMQQVYGLNARAEFLPLMLEVFRDVKAIFKANPVEVFTKGTGGSEYGFHSQRTLEDALSSVGDELHSQYVISYVPNNTDAYGFHEIRVEVEGHPEVKKIVTRLGYWMGPR